MNIKIVCLLLTISSLELNHETQAAVFNRTSTEIPDGKSELKYGNFDSYNNPSPIESYREVCDQYDSEECALKWLEVTDKVYARNVNRLQNIAFIYFIDKTSIDHKQTRIMVDANNKFIYEMCKDANKFKWRSFKNYTLKRTFQLIDPNLVNENFTNVHKINTSEQNTFSVFNNVSAQDSNRTDKNEKEANKPIVGEYYIKRRNSQNIKARKKGFNDAQELSLLKNFEQINFNETVMKIFYEIFPLYQQLHALIRHCLTQNDPSKFDEDGLIPNDTGSDIFPIMKKCYGSNIPNNITKEVEISLSNITIEDMAEMSEEFFESIGMFKMTEKFWNRSMFIKPENKTVDCHAAAADFFIGTDFRFKMCAKKTYKDLYIIYHEMGHLEYYMAYKNLPVPLRAGANSGFQEAVGDTIELSVRTPEYLKTIGLIKSVPQSNEFDIDFLMEHALKDILHIPRALIIAAFSWGVYNGSVADDELNEYWWSLHEEFAGQKSSVERSENHFDPGDKKHIAHDVPYTRYFFADICKFTFYESMCKEAGQYSDLNSSKPLHRCNFYRSKKAGKKFLNMLKEGKKRHWTETMQILTGPPKLGESVFNTRAILKYYKPLYDWLKSKNKKLNIKVGW